MMGEQTEVWRVGEKIPSTLYWNWRKEELSSTLRKQEKQRRLWVPTTLDQTASHQGKNPQWKPCRSERGRRAGHAGSHTKPRKPHWRWFREPRGGDQAVCRGLQPPTQPPPESELSWAAPMENREVPPPNTNAGERLLKGLVHCCDRG